MAGRHELASGKGEPCGWVAEQRSDGMREGGRGGGGERRGGPSLTRGALARMSRRARTKERLEHTSTSASKGLVG